MRAPVLERMSQSVCVGRFLDGGYEETAPPPHSNPAEFIHNFNTTLHKESLDLGVICLGGHKRRMEIRRKLELEKESPVAVDPFKTDNQISVPVLLSMEKEYQGPEDYSLPQDFILDTTFSPAVWQKRVIAQVSPEIDFIPDSIFQSTLSYQAVIEEIEYAEYLGLEAVILPLTYNLDFIVKVLRTTLTRHKIGVWLLIQISSRPLPPPPSSNSAKSRVTTESEVVASNVFDEAWSNWRQVCEELGEGLASDLKVCLSLGSLSDVNCPEKFCLDRWLAEPIVALNILNSNFTYTSGKLKLRMKNPSDEMRRFMYLVLESYVEDAQGQGLHPHLLLSHNSNLQISPTKKLNAIVENDYSPLSSPTHPPPPQSLTEITAVYNLSPIQSPLEHVSQAFEGLGEVELQRPPNPYLQAVFQFRKRARVIWYDHCKIKGQESLDLGTIAAPFGLGRGKLVELILEEAKKLTDQGTPTIFAVEEDRGRFVGLCRRKESGRKEWASVVPVHSPLKDFRLKEDFKADLVVMDITGHFGFLPLLVPSVYNALRSNLHKSKCYWLPNSYTSYLAPVYAPKLQNIVRNMKINADDASPYNRWYMGNPGSAHVEAELQVVISVSWETPQDMNEKEGVELLWLNSREEVMVVTGLMGFIDYTLMHKLDVVLSSKPPTEEHEILPYTPVYFPLKENVRVEAGRGLKVEFKWRCEEYGTETELWYQWRVLEPHKGDWHNHNGEHMKLTVPGLGQRLLEWPLDKERKLSASKGIKDVTMKRTADGRNIGISPIAKKRKQLVAAKLNCEKTAAIRTDGGEWEKLSSDPDDPQLKQNESVEDGEEATERVHLDKTTFDATIIDPDQSVIIVQ